MIWLLVSETPIPNDKEQIIIYHPKKGVITVSGDWRLFSFAKEITHWMPLPDPP